jgi:chemotaxis protein methyltransferase CheR
MPPDPLRRAHLQAPAAIDPAWGGGEPLTARNFARLAELVHDYSGIKMPDGKRTMLEGRLRRRMRATGVDDLNDYCSYLFEENGLDSEIVHLIDAITTNKTDFFREPPHFDLLQSLILPAIGRSGQRRIKAWSAACSIGAEPYTLAMVLQENRRLARGADYSILCTDLSTEVLEQAVAGVFPEAMIEPVHMDLRWRYLMRCRETALAEVRIVPELRAKLSFARLNLMDESYPVDHDMDLIFCRNILIYFDKETQLKVLQRLCGHLAPGGHLFLGHSESIVGLDLPVVQIANTIFQRR